MSHTATPHAGTGAGPIGFAVGNPIKVAVGVILLLLFGVLAFRAIPVQLTPDVDPTMITVSTEWTGTAPEEVEREIIEPQEDVLKNVRNLFKMQATASQGQAEIELEFTVGTDLDAAYGEVSDALREVSDYPDDADEPTITRGEAGAGSPVAWMLLTADDPAFNLQGLGDPAEERIKPFFERVDGVSEVRVYGGREREVHVDFDPARLAQRGVTVEDLGRALSGENTNVSAGDLQEGRYDVRVRTVGRYDELEQVERTVVAYDEAGGPIRVRDFAEVSLGYAKRRGFVRSRGQIALAFPVYKEPGANVIAVLEEVRSRLGEMNDEVLPAIAQGVARQNDLERVPVLRLEQVYDETIYINDALALVQNNLVVGGVLAVVALLVFLEWGRRRKLVLWSVPTLVALMILTRVVPGGWPLMAVAVLLLAVLVVVLARARPTLIIALSIPICVIGTFVVMVALGRNINVISLAGLAFATGMVVDNGIVVLENIDRHLQLSGPDGRPKSPIRASLDGASEVWGAVLASTLTTLAVFLPVLTVAGEAGQLFRDIAIALSAAVALSLVVGITVIPAASARLLRRRTDLEQAPAGEPNGGVFGRLAAGFSERIVGLMQPTRTGVAARVAILSVVTAGSLLGAWLLMPPTDYLPRGNKNLVFGIVLTPPGYNVDTAERIGRAAESVVEPFWEATTAQEAAELTPPVNRLFGAPATGAPPVDNYFFVSFGSAVFNGATSQDKNSVAPLQGLLSAATTGPWGLGFAEQSSLFGRGAAGSRQIDVEVSATQLDEVTAAASSLLGAARELYGFTAVRPDPGNFDRQSRELRVELDRVKAAELGVDVENLGRAVAAMVDGVIVGEYRLFGESIDLRARRLGVEPKPGDGPTEPVTVEALSALPIAYRTATGETGSIPLGAIAAVSRTLAPQTIRRIEERRAVVLSVVPPAEVPLGEATAAIQKAVAGLREAGAIAATVEVRLAGSAGKLAEVRDAMVGTLGGDDAGVLGAVAGLLSSRLLLALLVTYLLMAALFESFLYPLVVLFAVPLAAVGGFIGLGVVHHLDPTQQLDTLTMLGFIILIGVVVNNAILIVHQSLNFQRGAEGPPMDARSAIGQSVRTRLRPILMTTCTSVAGMLPLVLTPGSGSELYRGLGAVIVGGLVCATLFTLVIVPLLLSLVMREAAAEGDR
ncbi:efflux system inner membrane protein [Phycisphaera mikurensis NBRC 102666]|uniref:Efflux system inner membrane protein n=1 Tax=Phycisphaera mikurensis (strain NBRC 102666 / KCTC 22515 / FYK2301M01) TaxID=1142394 RepID=I0IFE8_PHYMF|nr:efflux system inner membrane protein [Phycisphaera mikurensis NBRC 102666]